MRLTALAGVSIALLLASFAYFSANRHRPAFALCDEAIAAEIKSGNSFVAFEHSKLKTTDGSVVKVKFALKDALGKLSDPVTWNCFVTRREGALSVTKVEPLPLRTRVPVHRL